MREIKFKFWLGHTKKMTYSHTLNEINTIIPQFTKDIIPLQYTGLKDKNGKEIYEGDVLKASESIIKIQYLGRGYEGVYLNKSQAHESPIKNNNYLHWSIIGNIHENLNNLL